LIITKVLIMLQCPNYDELQSYNDGELDADRRAAIAQHLLDCSACGQVMARLSAMSQMFADFQPRLSQIGLARLHQKVARAAESGLLRIAWTISTAAACVLVAGSVWLTRTNSASPVVDVTPPWASIPSTNQDSDLQSSGTAITATPVADWYLADASPRDDVQ
jgi:anti-sigma factor RsiW